jgi:hypothetical protein
MGYCLNAFAQISDDVAEYLRMFTSLRFALDIYCYMNGQKHKLAIDDRNSFNDTLKNPCTDYIFNNLGGRYN